MADILVKIGADSREADRGFDKVERRARETAQRVERTFANMRATPFGDAENLRANARVMADIDSRLNRERASGRARETAEQERFATRTAVYAQRSSRAWEESERRKEAAIRMTTRTVARAATATVGALTLAHRWASEYAQEFDHARGSMDRFNKSLSDMKRNISRDLPSAFNVVAPVIEGVEDVRGRMVDTLANAARGDSMYSARLRDTQETLERQQVSGRQNEAFARDRDMQALEAARARGDTRTAADLEERMGAQDYARQINARVAAGEITAGQGSELVMAQRARLGSGRAAIDKREARDKAEAAARVAGEADRETAQRESAARAAALRAAGNERGAVEEEIGFRTTEALREIPEGLDKGREAKLRESIWAGARAELAGSDRDLAEKSRDREDRRGELLERHRLEMENLRIDDLRAKGQAKEADAARVRLDFQRRINEAKREELYTDEERQAIIGDLEGARDRTLRRLETDDTAGVHRSLESGIADPLVRQQALGPGSGVVVARQHLDEAKKQTGILARIAESSGVTA